MCINLWCGLVLASSLADFTGWREEGRGKREELCQNREQAPDVFVWTERETVIHSLQAPCVQALMSKDTFLRNGCEGRCGHRSKVMSSFRRFWCKVGGVGTNRFQ